MLLIPIDIETGRDEAEYALDNHINMAKENANVTNPDTAAKQKIQKGTAAWEATSLDGLYGNPLVISWAVDDGPIFDVHRIPGGLSVVELLADFWTGLRESIPVNKTNHPPTFIGWNVQFDLRFLWMSCVRHGVKPPIHIPHDAPPWKDAYIDLMQYFPRPKRNEGCHKLKHACEALGIPDDGDIDGSEVWDAIQAGQLDDVVTHCRADVERVREIYKRVTFA